MQPLEFLNVKLTTLDRSRITQIVKLNNIFQNRLKTQCLIIEFLLSLLDPILLFRCHDTAN